MKFEKGKWHKTTDGYDVEFIVPIEKDGMYNVFRHTEDNDFRPYYTDENGVTSDPKRRVIIDAPNDIDETRGENLN